MSNYQQKQYPQGFTCKCGGLKPAPGVAYGYVGPMCHCSNPTPETQTSGLSQIVSQNSDNFWGVNRSADTTKIVDSKPLTVEDIEKALIRALRLLKDEWNNEG